MWKKTDAGGIVLEMMALRLNLYESAAGLEQDIEVLLAGLQELEIPGAGCDRDLDEEWEPLAELIPNYEGMVSRTPLGGGIIWTLQLLIDRARYLR